MSIKGVVQIAYELPLPLLIAMWKYRAPFVAGEKLSYWCLMSIRSRVNMQALLPARFLPDQPKKN